VLSEPKISDGAEALNHPSSNSKTIASREPEFESPGQL